MDNYNEELYISTKTDEEVDKSSKQISIKKQDVKYDTRDYVIKYLVDQFAEGEFYIPLEYQRQFIWNDHYKCYFIESILMGLPIPFMFFADTDDGRIEIVDGAQRTQTLIQFAQNDLQLNNLRVLTESNGFRFKDFDIAIQRRFLNTSIRVVFLEEGTTERTRQEIFKRINTGGISANPSETRRGSYEGRFKNFIEECIKNPLFNKLAPRTELTEKRYEGFELISRFVAYSDNFSNDFEGYTGQVALYIDNYIDKKNQEWEHDETQKELYRDKLDKMLSFAEKLLGERGFRKTIKSKSTPRARFEAISVGISLALETGKELNPNNNEWLDSETFADLIKSDAANNKTRLKGRISFVKDALLG